MNAYPQIRNPRTGRFAKDGPLRTPIVKTCEVCGGDFVDRKHPDKRLCSIACRSIANRKPELRRDCKHCGIEFAVAHDRPNKQYCSHKCSTDAKWLQPIPCRQCGQLFQLGSGKIFCSINCYNDWQREHPRLGPEIHNWKGGSVGKNQVERRRFAYREWREAVFARDNWTCQDCGERGVYLHAHHMFTFAEYPEHRYEVWNGITLCRSCHAKIHPNLKKKVVSGQD